MRRKHTPTKFFMMKFLNHFDASVDIPSSIEHGGTRTFSNLMAPLAL